MEYQGVRFYNLNEVNKLMYTAFLSGLNAINTVSSLKDETVEHIKYTQELLGLDIYNDILKELEIINND